MKKTGEIEQVVDGILARYPAEPSSLISVLEDLQESLRYLPEDVLNTVALRLDVPRTQVYYVATFYKSFSLTPRGKHLVSICRGTACHVKGADRIAEMLHAELGVHEGETTDDGAFTVENVRCLGCCSLAPAVMIDREVYGDVTPPEMRKIIKTCRDGS